MRAMKWFAVLLVALLPALAEASVREKLRKELQPLVEHIVQVAKDEKQTTVAYGEISKIAQRAASVAPGIEQILKDELTKSLPEIQDSALSITGKCSLVEQGTVRFVSITISLDLTSGKPLGEKKQEIRDSELVAYLLGITQHLPPLGDKPKLQGQIADAIEGQKPGKTPTFVIRNKTQLATSGTSPFGVEFLVTSVANAPKDVEGWNKIPARELTIKDGYPVLPIDKGEVYALRLTNTTDREAAVAIAIDGVDSFQLTERPAGSRPPFSHHLVASKGSALVTGWFKSLSGVSSFLVTGQGEGVAEKLGLPRGNRGTLSVTFALAWEGDNVPPDETGKRGGEKETGEGPLGKIDARPVKRTIGVIRDVFTVLYDR